MKRTSRILSFVLVMIMLATLVLTGCGEEPVRQFDDNDEFISYVLTEQTNDIAENYDSCISSMGNFSKGFQGSAEVSVSLGKTLINLLEDEIGIDLSKLGTVSAAINMAMDDKGLTGDLGLKIGSTSLVSGNVGFDFDDLTVYASVPELNRTPIVLDLAAAAGLSSYDREEFDAGIDMFRNILKGEAELQKKLPSGKEISALLKKYINLFLKDMKRTERSEETITADGISQKCTALTLEITEKMAAKGATNVLKELRNDSDIKEILKNVLSVMEKYFSDVVGDVPDADEVWDELKDEVDEALEDLEDLDFDSEDTLLLKVYVDNRNNLIGLEVGFGGETFVTYYEAHDGKKVGHEIFVGEDSRDGVSIVGSGTEQNGAYTETLTVTLLDRELATIKLENFKADAKSINGKAILMPSRALLSEINAPSLLSSMQLVLNFKNVTQNGGTLEVAFANGDDIYFTVGVNLSVRYGVNVSMPDTSKAVNILADPNAANEWLSNLDLDEMMNKLQKALPEELYEMLINELF